MNNNIEREIFDIYVDDIIPNRFQPRLTFDEKSLNELADSIKQHGIIQPLVVRKVGDKYEIIAGERRYKAAQIAGLQKVPAVIMNLDDKESAEVAVVENIQRRDLSALEEAESYKKLLDKGYLTQEQLATRMGKTQSTVSNKLRLLGLDDEVKDALLNEKISERHARSLLSLKEPSKQKEVLSQIINNKLTVKQTDDLIKSMLGDSVETLDFNNVSEILPTDSLNSENVSSPSNNSITEEVKDDTQVKPSPIPFVDIPDIVIQDADKPLSENKEPPLVTSENQTNDNKLKFEALPTIDVDKMKEEAEDINKEAPVADIDNLIGIKPLPETSVEDDERTSPVPKFRFINPLDDEEEETEGQSNIPPSSNSFFDPIPVSHEENNNIAEPKTYTDSLVQEYRQANNGTVDHKGIVPGEIRSAIGVITDLTKELEKNNFKIEVEEFDFEHLYQMIIKIQK